MNQDLQLTYFDYLMEYTKDFELSRVFTDEKFAFNYNQLKSSKASSTSENFY